MLNLACSDSIVGAFRKGGIVTIPGRTDSGKTILGVTTLACCANNPEYSTYSLVYDDVESKLNIDIVKIFNEKTKQRIRPPKYGVSNSIQDFESNILYELDNRKSCIYVLDTPDALTSNEELEKSYERILKNAKSTGDVRSISGSYYMEKAKLLHRVLRELNNVIEKSRSLLIMLQQSRDKIGFGFGRRESTAGGKAPAHYSTHRIWMIPAGKIKKKNEVIGIKTVAQIEKNHYNGKLREVELFIYYDYGIDDIRSIINWIVENKYWSKEKQRIIAKELGLKLGIEKLITTIEENGLENKLKKIVQKLWNNKEESLLLYRKKRFQ